jgi:hypothetical protein
MSKVFRKEVFMTNTMEWEEDLRVQLTYLDVPKKYHQGLIDFVEEKLTTARKEAALSYRKMIEKMDFDMLLDLIAKTGKNPTRKGAIAQARLDGWNEAKAHLIQEMEKK